MASNLFQNTRLDLNAMWYDSHKSLLKRVAAELGASEKQDELIEKFLGNPLKIKKQRDPLMPKRPKSSFLFFCDHNRQPIRDKTPDLSMGMVMKELGKQWSDCDEEDRTKFEEMSKNAKSDYESNLEEYHLNNYYE